MIKILGTPRCWVVMFLTMGMTTSLLLSTNPSADKSSRAVNHGTFLHIAHEEVSLMKTTTF